MCPLIVSLTLCKSFSVPPCRVRRGEGRTWLSSWARQISRPQSLWGRSAALCPAPGPVRTEGRIVLPAASVASSAPTEEQGPLARWHWSHQMQVCVSLKERETTFQSSRGSVCCPDVCQINKTVARSSVRRLEGHIPWSLVRSFSFRSSGLTCFPPSSKWKQTFHAHSFLSRCFPRLTHK